MIGATIFAVVFFVFLIAICIGFIILQIRLSKMDSKWPGLVLPAITLLLSLVAAITVFARADIGAYGNMWNVVLSAFIAFLSNNVSTIVLAGIYLYQRDKINRRAELARMNVQDLQLTVQNTQTEPYAAYADSSSFAPLRAAWMIKPVTWSQGSSRNRSRTPCHFG